MSKTTIDTDQTAQDIRSLISNLAAAQNALAAAQRTAQTSTWTCIDMAQDDLHRLRGNIRTMAQRMGVEY